MRTNKTIKSIPKKSSVLILTIGGPLAILIGTFLIFKGNGNLGVLILGIPFIFLGVYSLYWMYNFDILIISNGNLIFKSITGFTKKTIPLSEFDSYSEIEKENTKLKHEVGYMKWKDLTLIGDNFKYKISSTSYTNYNELKKELTIGLKRNLKAELKWQNNNLTYIGLGIILFGLLIGFWFWQATKDNLIDKILSIILSLGFIGYGIYLLSKRKKPAGNNV